MIFSNIQLTIKDALPILRHLLKDILYQFQNKEDIEAAKRRRRRLIRRYVEEPTMEPT